LFHADGQTEKQAETDRQTADRQKDRQTADRQTDMTKLIVSYSNFANTPNKRVLGLNLCRCVI